MKVKIKRTKKLRSEVDERYTLDDSRKSKEKSLSIARDSLRKHKYSLQSLTNGQ